MASATAAAAATAAPPQPRRSRRSRRSHRSTSQHVALSTAASSHSCSASAPAAVQPLPEQSFCIPFGSPRRPPSPAPRRMRSDCGLRPQGPRRRRYPWCAFQGRQGVWCRPACALPRKEGEAPLVNRARCCDGWDSCLPGRVRPAVRVAYSPYPCIILLSGISRLCTFTRQVQQL